MSSCGPGELGPEQRDKLWPLRGHRNVALAPSGFEPCPTRFQVLVFRYQVSVRKVAQRMRITSQLIDATTGAHCGRIGEYEF